MKDNLIRDRLKDRELKVFTTAFQMYLFMSALV